MKRMISAVAAVSDTGCSMEKAQAAEDSTIQNLRDAGCDEAFISRFAHLDGENATHRIALLREHRVNLLLELHEDQKRIDCLDYLIYQIQKAIKGKENRQD